MKLVYLLILSLLTALVLSACNVNTDLPPELYSEEGFEEEEIKFDVEQILYSKSYQSIEPTVELITKNNKLKLLASLGLGQYSSVNVNRIVKRGSEVAIHVSGTALSENHRLAVPQIILEVEKLKLKNSDDLRFSVIYDDYKPIKIKFGINDVINKVQAYFKISPSRLPSFNLLKENDDILWTVSYEGIIDKDDYLTPLINLSTVIDANSGEILQSDKSTISTTFDQGLVLDFTSESSFLYKRARYDKESDKFSEQLWYGDGLDKDKFMLFSSDFKISSAKFNEDKSHVSLLETNEDNSNLYIISLKDKRAFKISCESKFNPRLMTWKGKDSLYLIESDHELSTVYRYDLGENDLEFIGSFERSIDRIVNRGQAFLMSERINDEANRKILFTEDWETFKIVAKGFNPKFVSNNTIAYLGKDEKKDLNYLYLYNLEEKRITDIVEGNIMNFEVLPSGNLIYVNKNMNYDDYTILKYLSDEKESIDMITATSNRVFFNENEKLLYLNIALASEENKLDLIYEVDIDKINENQNP
ncbi:MAG: hypothetical protein WCZ27_04175 [Tissierellaceae bacterium]